jgi:hypothetical protein
MPPIEAFLRRFKPRRWASEFHGGKISEEFGITLMTGDVADSGQYGRQAGSIM